MQRTVETRERAEELSFEDLDVRPAVRAAATFGRSVRVTSPDRLGRLRRSLRRRSVRRRHRGSRVRRRRILVTVLLVVALFLPVPWVHVMGENPPGMAWRLDGRLEVEGEIVDPAGRWSWLTVGRPKLVFEVLRDGLTGREDPTAEDLREAAPSRRPGLTEPAAAAVGLNRAGRSIAFGLVVEAHEPIADHYPDDVVITAIDGIPITDRASLTMATRVDGPIEFETADGRTFWSSTSELPYERIRLVDLAPDDFEAAIYGRLPDVWPITWFRSLALGNSHGLMVAITTYAHVAEQDLAQGRHIAGTGGIRGDGTVTRIGGLQSKAAAARDAGANVLLYPAQQGEQLVGFDAGRMKLVPVRTLDDAIEWLEQPVGSVAGQATAAG